MNQEVSQRYAKALFNLAHEHDQTSAVLNEIREFNLALEKDKSLASFFNGPTVPSEEIEKVLSGLFEKKKFTEDVKGILVVLAQKRRFRLLPEIVKAFQAVVDLSQGVDRGQVRSASTLFPEDRVQLENTISRYTGKKVVLEYQEDKGLLGGLMAKVGSFIFDDSLETQLRLMRDELRKRRAN